MVLVTEEQKPILKASRDSVRQLYQLLKAIAFRETATFTVNEQGIKVTVDDLHCLQATVYLKREIFQHFEATQVPFSFRLPLAVLCECLNLFGHEPGCPMGVTLQYAGYGSPLKCVLDRQGIYTECAIKTLEPEDIVDFEFDGESVASKVIMKPDALRDILTEVDAAPSSSNMSTVCMSVTRGMEPTQGNVRLVAGSGTSEGLNVCCDMPTASNGDLLERFECNGDGHEYRYRTSMLKKTLPALRLANKISLRTDNEGCMSIQYMIDLDHDQVCFIEFYCAPDTEVED